MAPTKPITTENHAGAGNPVPSQSRADEVRKDAVATDADPESKPSSKAKKPAEPASDAPFPTQADLDAMKAGNYVNREMKSR